nr:phosphoadenylyl-sulfate reductase [Calidifontibacillus oryziterrae]
MECLKWAFQHYQDEVVYACSFGAESIVLLDLISKIKQDCPISFIDTNLHFIETYKLIEHIKKRYPNFTIHFLNPNLTLTQQADQFGEKLWETNPDQCCQIRKIEPLREELLQYKAWISGLRREQSKTREGIQYINKDDKFKLVKICPLIHWTWEEIWMYINFHNLPYNPLHDQGYPSIGCEVCTMPVSHNDDLRAGRWKNHQKTECGLHLS